jgi:lysozyme family protein
MMSAFEKIHSFVFVREGGYCNDPGDPGGPTKYGVSLRWLTGIGLDVNKDGRIDAADIRALTPLDARSLFKHYFWDYLRCGEMPEKTGMVMYDTAVNTGSGQAVKFLQRQLNDMGAALAVDGAIGPKTLAAAREREAGDEALASGIIRQRESFYRELAAKPPTKTANYALFLRGWLNRTAALRELVGVA